MTSSSRLPTSLNLGLLGKAGFILLFLFAAMLFGLVSVTANPIIIGMFAGLLVGAVLIGKPIWNMWLIISLGLILNGILPLFVSTIGSKAAWGISILGFILLLSVLFTLVTTQKAAKNTPGFLWLAFALMFYIAVDSALQWHGKAEYLGGIKRYFQVWGLMFAIVWLRLDNLTIHRLLRFMLIVALIQLPFALYELIKLVPMREALVDAYPGMVPIDVVAGTFGASLYGGGSSGQMATFQILVFGFLLARWHEKTLSFKNMLLLSIGVLTPLFLGETKIVVILLPLMFLVLYRFELIKRPHFALFGFIVLGLMTILATYVYMGIDQIDLYDFINGTLKYNVHDKGYGGYILNRTSVFPFWMHEQSLRNPISFVFGNGVGSVQSVFGSLTPGHIALLYPMHGLGMNAGSTLLWDTGIFGFALYLLIFALAWRTANKLRQESAIAVVRADASAIQVALVMLGVHLVYSLSLLDSLNFQIVFCMILGYLAWLYRQHVELTRQTQ